MVISQPCGCMVNAWNAKWVGTWIDCIPNRTHIARYSKFNRARLFDELSARQQEGKAWKGVLYE